MLLRNVAASVTATGTFVVGFDERIGGSIALDGPLLHVTWNLIVFQSLKDDSLSVNQSFTSDRVCSKYHCQSNSMFLITIEGIL